jgi:hypothetical protein
MLLIRDVRKMLYYDSDKLLVNYVIPVTKHKSNTMTVEVAH